jgi:hypothetical protein
MINSFAYFSFHVNIFVSCRSGSRLIFNGLFPLPSVPFSLTHVGWSLLHGSSSLVIAVCQLSVFSSIMLLLLLITAILSICITLRCFTSIFAMQVNLNIPINLLCCHFYLFHCLSLVTRFNFSHQPEIPAILTLFMVSFIIFSIFFPLFLLVIY